MDKSSFAVSRRELYNHDGVIVLSSDTERLALTEPLSNKLYVVGDKLWRWDGSWVCLNEDVVDISGNAGSADVASQLISDSINRMGKMYYNIANKIVMTGTAVYGFMFKTNVPRVGSAANYLSLHVHGYSYTGSSVVDFVLSFYHNNAGYYYVPILVNRSSGTVSAVKIGSDADDNMCIWFEFEGNFRYSQLQVDAMCSTTTATYIANLTNSTLLSELDSDYFSYSDSYVTVSTPTTKALVTGITGNATTSTTATNATNLGGVAASSYVTNTGGATITGDVVVQNSSSSYYVNLSSSDTSNVYVELKRGTVSSWRMLNNSGTLRLQNNFTSSATDYFNVLSLAYNTGNATFVGTVTAPTFIGDLVGNADTATTATTATNLGGIAAANYVQTTGDISSTTIGGVNLLTYIDSKIAEAIEALLPEEQWQSFNMSGGIFSSTTFTLSNGVYTSGTMSFIATDTGWSLDGFAMGLTTTDDVEYPYQATNWLQAGSAVTLTFTKIS